MKTEEWYTEDECKRIIESDAVVDSAFLYKHLNLAFQKGKQIGSGEAAAELERTKDYDELVEDLTNSKEIRNAIAENCNNWRGRSHTKAVELKHMTAELERVKAELEEANKNVQLGLQFYKSLVEKNAELTSLKSRLPKNADEENPSIDWKQFVMDDEGELVEFIIASMHKESGEVYVQGSVECEPFEYVTPLLKDCHSTAESCRAAAEGGETNG